MKSGALSNMYCSVRVFGARANSRFERLSQCANTQPSSAAMPIAIPPSSAGISVDGFGRQQ